MHMNQMKQIKYSGTDLPVASFGIKKLKTAIPINGMQNITKKLNNGYNFKEVSNLLKKNPHKQE